MLVKFLDKNEQPVWVNPLHVKYMQPKGKGTLLVLGYMTFLRVTATPEEAAEAISAALPDQVMLVPEDEGGHAASE